MMTDDFHSLITDEWMEDGILHVGLPFFCAENFIPLRMQWDNLHFLMNRIHPSERLHFVTISMRLNVALLFIFFKVDAWELSIMYGSEIFYTCINMGHLLSTLYHCDGNEWEIFCTDINMRLTMNVLKIQYQRLYQDYSLESNVGAVPFILNRCKNVSDFPYILHQLKFMVLSSNEHLCFFSICIWLDNKITHLVFSC
jgi:hypothetical protein